jgi:hypothetical protein
MSADIITAISPLPVPLFNIQQCAFRFRVSTRSIIIFYPVIISSQFINILWQERWRFMVLTPLPVDFAAGMLLKAYYVQLVSDKQFTYS